MRLERGGIAGGGVFYKLQVARLKLCASRAFLLVFAKAANSRLLALKLIGTYGCST